VDEVAAALLEVAATQNGELLRESFVRHCRLDRHLDKLAAALHTLETAANGQQHAATGTA
jgi:hypothetical protein